MTDKKLRIGVIGLGMGKGHIRGFKTHPRAEVAAVADPDTARLETVADENNIPGKYASGEEMLESEQLDVVSIATPNKFHKPLTVKALASGCHVLCEKPMAMNAAEACEMRDAAARAGKRLMINFSFRFSEQAHALKKQVDNGVLGEVYYGRTQWLRRRGMPGFGGWFGRKEMAGGGPLIDLGVHRLDLALWFMGYPKPVWVLASTYDHIAAKLAKQADKPFDVEDFAAAMIKFDNGATLTLEASWAGNVKEREKMSTQLLGTKGGLVHHNVGEWYDFEAELYMEKDGCQYDMKLHPPVPEAKSSMHHFVESILSDTQHIATADEGVIVMELLDAIYESARTGEPVRVA